MQEILTHFRKVATEQRIPNEWKIVIIKSVFDKAKKTIPHKYHGIERLNMLLTFFTRMKLVKVNFKFSRLGQAKIGWKYVRSILAKIAGSVIVLNR